MQKCCLLILKSFTILICDIKNATEEMLCVQFLFIVTTNKCVQFDAITSVSYTCKILLLTIASQT